MGRGRKQHQRGGGGRLDLDTDDELAVGSPVAASLLYGRSPASMSGIPMDDDDDQPVNIRPRNAAQQACLDALYDEASPIVLAVGPAGVAKTYLATAVGLQQLLEGNVTRLVITRPAVCVDEQHGFLPGTLEDKMDPWLRPIYDVFHRFVTPKRVQALMARGAIEICPLAYMRGRTFERAFVCADECQNTTVEQLKMLVTRLGNGSKLVVNGDPGQADRGFARNGLVDLLSRLEVAPLREVRVVRFGAGDVERHPVIPKLLKLYE